jgi:hypothetical protein
MIEIILFIILLVILIFCLKKENYQYETLYNAYELPFSGDSFIAAGKRPSLGHYLRTDQDGSQESLIQQEYTNIRLKNDPCNICMVKCLNPTSVAYRDKKKLEIVNMCRGFCEQECAGRDDIDAIIEEARSESRKQLRHNIYNHEDYTPNVFNYFDQGGWRDFPEWME